MVGGISDFKYIGHLAGNFESRLKQFPHTKRSQVLLNLNNLLFARINNVLWIINVSYKPVEAGYFY